MLLLHSTLVSNSHCPCYTYKPLIICASTYLSGPSASKMSKPNTNSNSCPWQPPPPSIDPKSGFCSVTKVYHSLRPPCPLPSPSTPLSFADFAYSLLPRPSSSSPAFIEADSRRSVSFSDFVLRSITLSSSIHRHLGLKKGDTAFILSPSTLQVPILYYALLSLGVVVSPSNPASSELEIAHQIHLSNADVAFATSDTAHKLHALKTVVLLDSPGFESWMTCQPAGGEELERVKVYQSDPAAILYSSGTTGRFKGVLLTHRNFTANLAAIQAQRPARASPVVNLCTAPYFHIYGMSFCLRTVAMGQTVVLTGGRLDMKKMLRAVEEFRVTHLAFTPSVMVALVKDAGVTDGYDLSSLEVVSCGGAALGRSIEELFRQRFPHLQLFQGYGLTESTARMFGLFGPRESQVLGATGKLMPNSQAKIVDPETGILLPPGSPGELWVRGPYIMKGYVGDEEATAATLDSEGWLKTGDLCYIDNEGFLFFVDRIKELIKYKGYQVAPAELEHLLHSHPDIVEASVAPYPDEVAGQLPVAFVVRKIGSTISETQIKDFIAEQVAPYKRLRRVMFINSLPKNATGKVLRRELIKIVPSSASSKV